MTTKRQNELKSASETEREDLTDRLEDDFISAATDRYIAYLERRLAKIEEAPKVWIRWRDTEAHWGNVPIAISDEETPEVLPEARLESHGQYYAVPVEPED